MSKPEGRGFLERARRYPIVVVPGEDEPFAAHVPDLPQVAAFGDTPEQVTEEAVRAIASAIEVFERHGESLPEPMSSFTGRIELEVPRALHQALAARAAIEGTTVSATATYLLARSLGIAAPPARPQRGNPAGQRDAAG